MRKTMSAGQLRSAALLALVDGLEQYGPHAVGLILIGLSSLLVSGATFVVLDVPREAAAGAAAVLFAGQTAAAFRAGARQPR